MRKLKSNKGGNDRDEKNKWFDHTNDGDIIWFSSEYGSWRNTPNGKTSRHASSKINDRATKTN
ncbi:hypothetical protein NC3_03480 [Bacillus altitudinis]|nr:hypothetical protein NC3_03480 [Bacillus altitudinis]